MSAPPASDSASLIQEYLRQMREIDKEIDTCILGESYGGGDYNRDELEERKDVLQRKLHELKPELYAASRSTAEEQGVILELRGVKNEIELALYGPSSCYRYTQEEVEELEEKRDALQRKLHKLNPGIYKDVAEPN